VRGRPERRAREIEYGVGVRLRSVWIPQWVLDRFVAHAGAARRTTARRRSDPPPRHDRAPARFEFEHINIGQGVLINRNDDVAKGNEADYVLGPDERTGSGKQFGWFTMEFTFLNHAEINRWLSVRYGGGLGLGVLIGELDHYNIICGPGGDQRRARAGLRPPRFQGTGSYSEGTETLVSTTSARRCSRWSTRSLGCSSGRATG